MSIKSMTRFLIIALIYLSNQSALAQSLEMISFGTDSTFEVITWNIERFPKEDQVTLDKVALIVERLDVDILALQEINNEFDFKQMVEGLGPEFGYLINFDNSGLAYIYKTASVEVLNSYEIFPSSPREFPRSPYVLRVRAFNQEFTLLNNHLKCCGNTNLEEDDPWDEETRRLDAMNALYSHIQNQFEDEQVILVGDLNDVLIDHPANNVFNTFLSDSTNFFFADMEIAEGHFGHWSYPSFPSHLDHILISNELFLEYEQPGTITQVLRIDQYMDGGFNQYEDEISDHRPVALKFKPESIVSSDNFSIEDRRLKIFPNPFTSTTTFNFDFSDEDILLEIYTSNGLLVESKKLSGEVKSYTWRPENLIGGLYFIKMLIPGKGVLTKKVLFKK